MLLPLVRRTTLFTLPSFLPSSRTPCFIFVSFDVPNSCSVDGPNSCRTRASARRTALQGSCKRSYGTSCVRSICLTNSTKVHTRSIDRFDDDDEEEEDAVRTRSLFVVLPPNGPTLSFVATYLSEPATLTRSFLRRRPIRRNSGLQLRSSCVVATSDSNTAVLDSRSLLEGLLAELPRPSAKGRNMY